MSNQGELPECVRNMTDEDRERIVRELNQSLADRDSSTSPTDVNKCIDEARP